EAFRKTGSRTVPDVTSRGIEEQDRGERSAIRFGETTEGIERRSKRTALGNHLEHSILAGEQRFGLLAIVYVGALAIPLDQGAGEIVERFGAEEKPAEHAIVAPQPCLRFPRRAGSEYLAPDLQQSREIVRKHG